jgi:hypothetical protein
VNRRIAEYAAHLNLVIEIISRHPNGISVARVADALGQSKDCTKYQIAQLRRAGRVDFDPVAYEPRPSGPQARVLKLTEAEKARRGVRR